MNQPTDTRRLRLGRFALVFFVIIAAAVAVYVFLGRIVIEKLVTDLCMPVGFLWLLLTVFSVELLRRKLYAPFFLSVVVWCCFYVSGNSLVADWMVRSLETPYLATDPLAVDPLDTVILLGGGAGESPNGRVQAGDSGDRVVLAARMYHRGLTRRIICTGAKIKELSTSKRDGAEQSRLLLIDLGVPVSAIEMLGGRNTAEEMEAISKKLAGKTQVGILTSAWHLPRAMRLAKRAGINAMPLPADFRSERREGPEPLAKRIRYLIPNQSALSNNTRVIKERLAQLVGR